MIVCDLCGRASPGLRAASSPDGPTLVICIPDCAPPDAPPVEPEPVEVSS